MRKSIKVGIYQMEVEGDIFEPDVKGRNLEKVGSIIEKKTDHDLIVLPDDFYAGYGYGVMNLPDFSQTKRFDWLGLLAKKHNLYIAGSSLCLPEPVQGLKSEARSFLIGPDGKVISHQNRFHLHNIESEWIISGSKVNVFDTDLGRIGFISGLDTFHSQMWDSLIALDVEIVLNPLLYISSPEGAAKMEVDIDFVDVRPVIKAAQVFHAYSGGIYVLSASAVGAYAQADEFKCAGESRIVFPTGKTVEANSDKEIFITSVIDSETLEKARAVTGCKTKKTKC